MKKLGSQVQQSQPQEARSNGYSKGPSKRRILRKDRRQTLEVLTSDDEVNEFVESRASAYIEPEARQRLHEVKPHLRSSFETLYSPQFDAMDSPAAVAKAAGWRGSFDSLGSLSDDESEPAAASSKKQLDRLWEGRTSGNVANANSPTQQVVQLQSAALTAAAAPSDAQEEMDRLADQILRSREERRPGQKASFDRVDSAIPATSTQAKLSSSAPFVFMRDDGAWTYGRIDSERDAETAESGSMQQQAVMSPIGMSGRRSLPKKMVVFSLPGELGTGPRDGREDDAMLARLRAKIGGGHGGGGGGFQSQRQDEPLSAADKLRQLIRSQPSVHGANSRSTAPQPPPPATSPPPLQPFLPPPPPLFETPSQPSMTQRLRALLPSGGEVAAGGFSIRQQPPSPSALSAELPSSGLLVDKHTPRRTGSLIRTGSCSSYTRQQQVPGKSLSLMSPARATEVTAPAAPLQQPIRRSVSMERQQEDQNSRQHYQRQNHQVTRYQQPNQAWVPHQKASPKQPYRSQDVPLPPPPPFPQPLLPAQPQPPPLPPPPLPPRRQKDEAMASVSIRLQAPQRQGQPESPSTEHVCKRIVLTAREAQRHQLSVTSSHYRLTRPVASVSRPANRHRPLRGWSHSQSSTSSVS